MQHTPPFADLLNHSLLADTLETTLLLKPHESYEVPVNCLNSSTYFYINTGLITVTDSEESYLAHEGETVQFVSSSHKPCRLNNHNLHPAEIKIFKK